MILVIPCGIETDLDCLSSDNVAIDYYGDSVSS